MATILGSDLMVFVDNKPIAFSTSAKISVNANAEDISSKDSGLWEESLITKFSWTVSTDALYSIDGASTGNSDLSELWTSFVGKTKVSVAFAVKDGTSPNWTKKTGSKAFTGSGYIVKLDANADQKGVANYSIEIKGDGELQLATVS